MTNYDTSNWRHLPAAPSIQRILHSVYARPDAWCTVARQGQPVWFTAAWRDSWTDVDSICWNSIDDDTWFRLTGSIERAADRVARHSADAQGPMRYTAVAWQQPTGTSAEYRAHYDAVFNSVLSPVMGGVAAVMTWPESVELIQCDPAHVQMLARLGQTAAVLMLPTCLAQHDPKKLSQSPQWFMLATG
jgi:hypothetical protein